MTGLRWTLGIITALLTVGLLVLSAIGDGFRRSFGASEKGPLLTIGTVVVAALIVASLAWPERRALLHVVAVLMLAWCVGCVFLARDTVFAATLGLMYAAGWFLFYYRAVWR